MKQFACHLCLLLTFSLFAQEKGVATIPNTSNPNTQSSTYAVVVGISDYQDEGIPDLRFADKDAEAFATFLQSPAGGRLDKDHLKVLINEKATVAQFAGALDWLMEVAGQNDRVIIYFSGHGDVETKTSMQLGFLLTYDSPFTTYIAGAFPIFYLQSVITTLSQKNIQVLMITDACRSGKLAGNEIGGAHATASNLAKQFANEIKIMSCQPNEYSLEGEQWGGGRGAFSFHLIDGLSGLADKNGDYQINLFEIGRYLEDKVSEEAAPHQQMPFTSGDRNSQITSVDKDQLALLHQQKAKEQPRLAGIVTKGFEETILSEADSTVQQLYQAFLLAIKQDRLLEPQGDSANDFYEKLIREESLQTIHGYMKRNFAAALQDDAQEAINRYMSTDPDELSKRHSLENEYGKYPKYLLRAAELLGEKHLFYKTLMARAHYFKGVDIRIKAVLSGSDSLFAAAMKEQHSALKHQPDAPFALNELGYTYLILEQYEKTISYCEKALQFSPDWNLPLANIGAAYSGDGDFSKGLEYAKKSLKFDPGFPMGRYNLASNYHRLKKHALADEIAIALLEDYPDYEDAYYLRGVTNLRLKNYELSEKMMLKYLSYQAKDIDALTTTAHLYLEMKEPDNAKTYFLKAKEVDPNSETAIQGMIEYSYYTGDIKGAESALKDYLALYPTDNFGYYLLSSCQVQLGKSAVSLESLEKAFKNGFKDLNSITEDPHYSDLVQSEDYKILIQKYFPD